ncbi:DUF6612 family protein [Luxibacter massiliensis]|uniref:DUF6612 family protein n=1 Tax=Luxibacter massiliensis TaxID=2219695 RepID=UPI000F0501DC|nr:DUF6612 family protein [Luxibacter massiliensis]
MDKKRKSAICALAGFLAGTIFITGCSGKLTPEKLMADITENLAEVQSVSNTLDMDIELEDVLETTSIAMDMELENTTDPRAGHAKGTAAVEMGETKVSSDIEIYQVTEGEESVTYSKMYDQWSRESAGSSDTGAFDGNLFQESGDSVGAFRIAEETVEVNERECYEMYGDITGAELMQFLGADMMGAFGLVEIPDAGIMEDMQIPVIIDVYKEEVLPARVIVDMTDVMNGLYDDYGKSTNVNDFTIELGYAGFDQAGEIVVPEEVRQACGEQAGPLDTTS